ncbi:antibiotic biosynthesis monooxygenase [halophilic archaeon]|nr:antibiotic biosynthesis monooxygenase [halophilic archaeon]
MIVVQTSVPIASDRRDEALGAIAALVEQSRKEDGVVDYRATTDLQDPDVVRFFERYEDETALEAHVRTDHYRAFVADLPDLTDGRLETVRFELDGEPAVVRFDAAEANLPDAEGSERA